MAQKLALHIMPSGCVIDRSAVLTLDSNNMGVFLTELLANAPKGVLVVDNADVFFTADNLITMIANKDGRYRLVNERIKFFTDDQIKALIGPQQAPAAQPEPDGGVVVKKAEPGYQWAEVPEGWTIGKNISLGATKIKRKIANHFGDSPNFYLSPANFQMVANAAMLYWSNSPGAAPSIVVKTDVGNRTGAFGPSIVAFGFTMLRRWEVEQIAKYRGWVPANLANAA